MSEIRFKLKKIVGFNWSLLDNFQKNDIIKSIFEFPLIGDEPNRFGFVKCRKINENRIYGFFTREIKEEKHRYNNQKKEEKYIDQPFEDFFFILLFDVNLCLLQSRRIRNISKSDIEEKFVKTLCHIFKEFGIECHLEDFSLIIEKDDFIKIFHTQNILYLRVGSLRGRIVPENFKIFNPNAEKDSIIRGFMNDDFRHIDEISTASDKGKLQESRLSKIILNTGEPKEIEYIDIKGEKIIIRDKIGPSISLNINIESPKPIDVQKEVEKFFSKYIISRIKEDNGNIISDKHQTTLDGWLQ